MSTLAAILLVVTTVAPPQAPRDTVALPEAVLTHPAAPDELLLQPPAPRWSQQALGAWPGPWGVQPGFRDRPDSYDHQYVTW
jgi:hypothetical protein